MHVAAMAVCCMGLQLHRGQHEHPCITTMTDTGHPQNVFEVPVSPPGLLVLPRCQKSLIAGLCLNFMATLAPNERTSKASCK